jgi:excisionase family DNA binding protein
MSQGRIITCNSSNVPIRKKGVTMNPEDNMPTKFASRATFSASEIAQMLGISKGLVYQSIHAGHIHAIALSERRYAVPRKEVLRLITEGVFPINNSESEGETHE